MHETAFPCEGSRLRVRTPKRRADDHTTHAQPNLCERQPEREREESGAHEGGREERDEAEACDIELNNVNNVCPISLKDLG